MKTIVELKFGSHLYGTATADSDLDIKAIYLPTCRDILLQRVRPAIVMQREKAPGERNTADDVDFEAYSPGKFLDLLASGHTVALDMLFAPDWALMKPASPLWRDIQALAPQLYSKQTSAFVGYCRRQARKYAVKGARLAAVRHALDALIAIEAQYGPAAKLEVAEKELQKVCAENALLQLIELPHANGGSATYFDVTGKKAILSASIKAARNMIQNLFDEFGARTRAAEQQDGVDWKAVSHAVRIAEQAVEFLETRWITFPRPRAEYLVAIKQGRVTYDVVVDEIETLLIQVEAAAERSGLPDEPAGTIADDFIADIYRRIVKEGHT